MPTIGRLLTAMVTPFTKDGDVDYSRAGDLAKKIISFLKISDCGMLSLAQLLGLLPISKTNVPPLRMSACCIKLS